MSFEIFPWCLGQILNSTSPQRDVCYIIFRIWWKEYHHNQNLRFRRPTSKGNHDVPSFSSDLLLDNKQTPLIFSSEYIFNSHYMFRHSGPGHMLLYTVVYSKGSWRVLSFSWFLQNVLLSQPWLVPNHTFPYLTSPYNQGTSYGLRKWPTLRFDYNLVFKPWSMHSLI